MSFLFNIECLCLFYSTLSVLRILAKSVPVSVCACDIHKCGNLTLRERRARAVLLFSLTATSTATAPIASTLSLVPVPRPRAVALGCSHGVGL